MAAREKAEHAEAGRSTAHNSQREGGHIEAGRSTAHVSQTEGGAYISREQHRTRQPE